MELIEKLKALRREIQYQKKYGKKIRKARKENKKLYICLGSAVHGNLGDQALGLCRVEFLKYCGISNSDIIEYTTRDKMRYWLQICRETKESDIIVLRGGGYWGDLWIDGFEEILTYIKEFRNNKIIGFPQSVYFSDSKEGNALFQYSKLIVKEAPKLIIFARDIESYKLLKRCYPESLIEVVPDTVLSYRPKNLMKCNRKGVILCLRNDKEKNQSIDVNKIVIDNLKKEKIEYQFQDTSIDFSLQNLSDRREKLFELWNKMATAELVITDRLHGMIFATITGTPCIVFNNIDGKVGHQFKWIETLGYVFLVKSEEEFEHILHIALSISDVEYPLEDMLKKYTKLADALKM